MGSKAILKRDDIMEFITRLYGGDLHAKRVLSLANATLGILASASLAIHAIGQGLAQALGKLGKHRVKQVDRLLSNEGVVVEEFFAHWVPHMVGARPEVVVALDWTSAAHDAQDTLVASMRSWSCDAAAVEDGEVVDAEGQSETLRRGVAVCVACCDARGGEGDGGGGPWIC